MSEFQRRFHPEQTNGEGTERLKNLYFIYLIELRALSKVCCCHCCYCIVVVAKFSKLLTKLLSSEKKVAVKCGREGFKMAKAEGGLFVSFFVCAL